MSYININIDEPGRDITVSQTGNTNSGGPYYADFTFSTVGTKVYGENIHGYTKLKKAGALLPHTPWFRRETQEIEVENGRWRTEHIPDGSVWAEWDPYVQHLPASFYPSAPDLSPADYALQKAAAEIYSEGWDALTFAAELPKTANMITGFGNKLRNLSRGLSKKKILSAWLEGRYGWRTLAYDARDIHHAVSEMEATRNIWSERQGFSSSQSLPDDYVVSSATNNDATVSCSGSIDESVRGAISAQISVSRFRTNPAETAWELVPLSFVLDWVYDVGTSIRALSFAAASSHYYSSIGYSLTHDVQFTTTFKSDFAGRQNGVWTGGVKFSGNEVSRTPTKLNFKPQVTNRLLSPDLALDLTGIAETRRHISSRR